MEPMEIALTLVGLGLSLFGIAFTVWAMKVKEMVQIAEKIDTRLIELGTQFNAYQVSTERRLARVEAMANFGK